MSGSVTELPPLLQAIAHVCEADGVNLGELRSIHFLDEEISIHFRRGDGRSRINTYPMAALRAAMRIAGELPAVPPVRPVPPVPAAQPL